jgi:ankyrin repeat protein
LKEGRAHFAQLYLEHGARTDIVMGNGNTPFIQSMDSSTEIGVIEMMLKFGTDPNGKNQHGETALFRAINASRFDLVQLLLERNANPNLPGPKHMLWPAVHKPEILEILLAKGANLKLAPGILELATSINSVEAVDALLKYHADPNAKKDGIYTPLCSAIRDDRENLVDKLLAAGADPNLAALDFPTFKCVSYHRPHLLTKVLKAGANLHHPKGIIEKCIEQNEIDCLAIVLEHGANVNERNVAGNTALTTAIKNNNLEVLDLLLHQGADPAIRGQEWPITLAVGNPAILARLLPHIETRKINKGVLERAVMADQLESVKMLLAKGVDVEDRNAGVFSPLTTSIREDRKVIFRYLLDEAGADPNSPGEHLPIIKAIRRHRADDLSYIQHLIERGADMNLMYRGWNAVLQALENGETQVFKLLAESGNPDLTARDEEGRSVIEIMQERGMKDELEILLGGPSSSPEIREALSQLRDMVRE